MSNTTFKEFSSEHPTCPRVDSTINVLLYLLYHLGYPSFQPSPHLIISYFLGIPKTLADTV